jgi:type IV pilus assembly protein PilA
MQSNTQNGFTLIELMIVVAIIGILAAVAIPNYYAYVARAQVTEAITMGSGLRVGLVELYGKNGNSFVGLTSGSAGIPSASSIEGTYVSSVAVSDGIVSVTFGNRASAFIDGEVLTLTPAVTSGGGVSWTCSFSASDRYVPSTCR